MWNDLKFAFRQLWKNPIFTAVAILTLALGIGANTAIFSVIDAVLLKPLPFREPDRLVTLWERAPARDVQKDAVTPPNFEQWQNQNTVFEKIGYWTAFDANLVLPDGVQSVRRAHLSSSAFAALGVNPQLGRLFTAEEDQVDGPRNALISHGLWQSRFGARPDIVGQTFIVDTYGRREYSIVGVMPAGFGFPDKTEIWLPAGWNGIPRQRHGHWLNVLARLKPGVTLAQAQAEMNTIQNAIARDNPGALIGSEVAIIPLLDQTLGPRLRPALFLLWGVVGGVMLIACANVANLLLARAVARRKEMTLRAALGASRKHIIRQLLTESALLSLSGGVAGALLGWWGLQVFLAASPADIPRLNEIRFDPRTLLFTFAISSITGFLFGLAPAWQFSRPDLDRVLREASHSVSGGLFINRLRKSLVVAEMAVSLVLLVGAGLMIDVFIRLLREDRGFQSEHVIAADLDFSVSGYTTWIRPTETRPQIKIKQLLDRLAAQPGVEIAAAASNLPRRDSAPPSQPFFIEGQTTQANTADYSGVSPQYFSALRVPLLRGRFFTEDDRLEASPVLIINEAFAKRFFPGQDPIGKRISQSRNPAIPDNPDLSRWPTIVGVVGDVKNFTVSADVHPHVFVPYWQWPMLTPTAFIRAKGDPNALMALVRNEVKQTISNLPVPKIRTMDSILSEVVAQPRFQAWLLSLFGALAAILAAIGLYGTLAYAVAQRTREIGIRMALGAQRRSVINLILREGMLLVTLGALVGAILAIASTQLLTRAFYGLRPDTLTPTLIVLAVLFLVALVACWFPARRASRVNPIEALRCE